MQQPKSTLHTIGMRRLINSSKRVSFNIDSISHIRMRVPVSSLLMMVDIEDSLHNVVDGTTWELASGYFVHATPSCNLVKLHCKPVLGLAHEYAWEARLGTEGFLANRYPTGGTSAIRLQSSNPISSPTCSRTAPTHLSSDSHLPRRR
jgi:hypothetical protein